MSGVVTSRMMFGRSFFFLLLASATCNLRNPRFEHECDPGSEVFACVVSDFVYMPGYNVSNSILSDRVATHKVTLISSGRRKALKRMLKFGGSILTYDASLHETLKRPRVVKLSISHTKLIEIPTDLEYGEFQYNKIVKVIVPPSETGYQLRFLDMSSNILRDIHNLSTLVNLETIILSNNKLSSITEPVFRRMANLTYLSLSMNRIKTISFDMLPPKLVQLHAHRNLLHDVDFSKANLPALEALVLNFNLISDLDVATIRSAAPKLKEIMLKLNSFEMDHEVNISTALKVAGIVHDTDLGVDKPSYSRIFYRNAHKDYKEDDDDRDESFYLDSMAQVWNQTIFWLIAIGKVCVVIWAVVYHHKVNQDAS